ncbi:hypothetical protein EZV73_26595 [Acidaminobacter sp. JC074]|uniref:XkdQ/YqbQ family protein n=1 Tax=Acidaminobacter sp. JC074 TaxID=2530199 RepID=UPI001F0FAD66|nr:hypothetical protein [Acidaminobacter sp. JC074]MCH4891176.1 hypothetical protein [Acidaminobacter sp. JC074]
MNFSLNVLVNSGEVDISDQSGNLAWAYDCKTLGVNLSFDFADISEHKVKPGSIVMLKDEDDQEVIFLGIVVSSSKKGKIYNFSAYDFAWYLNKSDVIIQFNKTDARTAIKLLCKKIGVEVGDIPYMKTLITGIHIDVKPSEILYDIINQVFLETGKKYFFEMNGSKLDVKEVGSEVLDASFRIADNLSPVKIEDVIGEDFTESESIENMKNSVIVVSSESDYIRVLETAKDQESINQYGLLQEVVKVDQKNESQSRNMAANTLKELNKIMTSRSIPLLGHKGLKQYRKLIINSPEADIVGEYIILSAAHSYSEGFYKTSISVEVA